MVSTWLTKPTGVKRTCRLVGLRLAGCEVTHPEKITFAEMRRSGIHGLLIYRSDYRCSYSVELSADGWPEDLRLSDIEPRFVCAACGQRGAEARQREPAGL